MPATRRKVGIVRSMLSAILSPIATSLAGFVGSGYNATDPRRKVISNSTLFANRATANQLLAGSLPKLRSYCRDLERNNPTARAAVEAIDGLVIGSGIDLEPDTGDDGKNAQIRQLFMDWMRTVSTDGRDIYQLQHIAMRECVTAGEWLWRIVPGDGVIPLRVLVLESEWLNDTEGKAPAGGVTVAAGVELDRYGNPVAYYMAPPEGGSPERVEAKSVVHGFERKRALQARGEPWFSPVIETLMNERDLVDAELKAAAITASIGIAVESENHPGLDTTEYGDADDPAQSVGLGSVVRLYPGEKVHAFGHTRPSQQIAPFRQMLRGDIAAAMRIPVRFLDRDVSRANYSSMRADMLDTQRLLGPIREWVGHQTIGRLYAIAAPLMSAKLGYPIDASKYRLLPDGQPYVDPQKDVAAAVAAIDAGISTHEEQVSIRGNDYRKVWAQLKKEAAEKEALGLKLNSVTNDKPKPPPAPVEVEDEEGPEDGTETEIERDENGRMLRVTTRAK